MDTIWPLDSSPVRAIPINFSFTPAGTGTWQPLKDGVEYRELGLADASNSVMSAGHLRASKVDRITLGGGHLLQLVVLGGTAAVAGPKAIRLKRYDTLFVPAGKRATIDCSNDFECLVFAAPSFLGLFDEAAQPSEDDSEFHVTYEARESYTAGDGPRDFFAYRNLDLARLTGGRIHIHLIRAVKQRQGGTGWHTHDMSQWFMVLEGSGAITVQGGGDTTLLAGDAMTLGARIRHNQTAYSSDYVEIEICIPAKYDTVPDQEPEFLPAPIGVR
jgi:mannose-6-phosphate isomerase-like protein (cupin superfamily)